MKLLFASLILLAAFSSHAQVNSCLSFYKQKKDVSIPQDDIVLGMLLASAGPKDTIVNYESKISAIAEKLKIPIETVEEAIKTGLSRLNWIEVPGTNGQFHIKKLWEVGQMKSVLYFLGPNFEVGPHHHQGDEVTVVLYGSFHSSDGQVFVAPATIRRPEGTDDPAGKAGPEGVLLQSTTVRPVLPIKPTP